MPIRGVPLTRLAGNAGMARRMGARLSAVIAVIICSCTVHAADWHPDKPVEIISVLDAEYTVYRAILGELGLAK